jgi:hypothetical protein
MGNFNQNAIGNTLEKLASNQAAEELFFDPDSGMVEVVKKGEVVHDPDRVPATEMAREGFFQSPALSVR